MVWKAQKGKFWVQSLRDPYRTGQVINQSTVNITCSLAREIIFTKKKFGKKVNIAFLLLPPVGPRILAEGVT